MKEYLQLFNLLIFLIFIYPAARAEDRPPIKLGGFLDTYYAYDFNNPKDHEREFTTQPVRHNEFNVNLAYIEAVMNQDNTRGRLALQFGHSVTKNTISEPRKGATSGPQDAKVFQEAFIGRRLGSMTWLDFGIFLGNIGAESWISKDNWTYTRALNLDYVPYYSSGVRLEHRFDNKSVVQFQILNGWQNISENNHGKAIGMQYKNFISQNMTFIYNNFFGDEEVVSTRPRFRAYHNFIFQWIKDDRWQYLAAFDVGHQSQQYNNGIDGWIATTLTIRRVLNSEQSVAFRMEYYADPHQSNIRTRTSNGFQVSGASLNFDQKLDENFLWRSELRGFYSKDQIYPMGNGSKNSLDGFLVTSFSAWI